MSLPEEEHMHMDCPSQNQNDYYETFSDDILLVATIFIGLNITFNIIVLFWRSLKSFLLGTTVPSPETRVEDKKEATIPEWLRSGSYKVTDYKQKSPKSSDLRFKYVVEPVKLTLEGYHTQSHERTNASAAGPPTAHSAPSILNLFDTEDEKITKVHHPQKMHETRHHAHYHHLNKTGKSPLNLPHKDRHGSTSYRHKHLMATETPVGHEQPAPRLQTYDVKVRPGVLYRGVKTDPLYTEETPDFIHPMVPVTPTTPVMPMTPMTPITPVTPMTPMTPMMPMMPVIRSHSRPPFVEIYHGRGKRNVPYTVSTYDPSIVHSPQANISTNHTKDHEVHYDNTYLLPPTVTPEQYTSIEPSSHSISADTKGHRIQTITWMNQMMHAQSTALRDSVQADFLEEQRPLRSQKTSEYLPAHKQINPLLRMESLLKETQKNNDKPAPTEQIISDKQDRDQPLCGRDHVSPISQDCQGAIISHQIAEYPSSLRPDPIKQISSPQRTEADMLSVMPEQGLLGNRDSVTKHINNQSQLATGSNLTMTSNVVDDSHKENSQHDQPLATSKLSNHDREAAPRTTRHEIVLVVGEQSTQEEKPTGHIPNLPPSINMHPYKGSVIRTYQRLAL